MYSAAITTPIGNLQLEVSDHTVHRVQFVTEQTASTVSLPQPRRPLMTEALAQLQAYFTGRLTYFDLPLALTGTGFQQSVYKELSSVAYGKTLSYQSLAVQLGKPPSYARAVGAACSRNPLLIIIPCHRIVSATGQLTGFAAGLTRKRWLIAFEQTTND